ncbi:MAG: adenylosuccinate synthase [Thermoplasmata archaeon]
MSVRVVIGAQYGDEAKGKISDYLAADARYVVRSGGGPNAGHSVHLPDGSVVLHQVATGVLRAGVAGVSGPGMVVQPMRLLDEIAELEQKHLLRGEFVLSDRAHVLLPIHELEDAWEDEMRTRHDPAGALGTTGRGIGPAYADRYGRWGIRYGELNHPGTRHARLELLYERKREIPNLPPIDRLETELADAGARLAPFIQDVDPLLFGALERGEVILLEGAQSALLDIDFGTYPFVTSSHPTSSGALLGSGLPPQSVTEVTGVAKAYCTRVGAGPFTTRAEPSQEQFLQRVGGERGATTGRARSCGWLDLVLMRYVARLNGVTSWAITKVDVLGGLEHVPVCVAYRSPDGRRWGDRPPTTAVETAAVTPVYDARPGWPEFHPRLHERIRREGASALPQPLRDFLSFIARETGVPVEIVSYGPQREETVRLSRRARGHAPALARWSK